MSDTLTITKERFDELTRHEIMRKLYQVQLDDLKLELNEVKKELELLTELNK